MRRELWPDHFKNNPTTMRYKRTTLEAWPTDAEAAQWRYNTAPKPKGWMWWASIALIIATILIAGGAV